MRGHTNFNQVDLLSIPDCGPTRIFSYGLVTNTNVNTQTNDVDQKLVIAWYYYFGAGNLCGWQPSHSPRKYKDPGLRGCMTGMFLRDNWFAGINISHATCS